MIVPMTKTKDSVVETKKWHGVLECDFTYAIKDTSAIFKYQGPTIPLDEWHQLMSFFRWTYKEHHSEAQARGFIDPVDNKLFFWVFPQEAGTGMTTKEIEGDEWNKQRASLPHADQLEYFMTVHHHCSASAFQSGGDSANEERPGGGNHETGQEGLHLTVGYMDKERHDLHSRFYLNGIKLAPSMANFWNIGDIIKAMIPPEDHDKVARYQMCQKVEMEFPEQWKKNYIEIKTASTGSAMATYRGGAGYFYGYGDNGTAYKPLQERIEEKAVEIVEEMMTDPRMTLENLKSSMEFLRDSIVMDSILTHSTGERFDAIDIGNLMNHIVMAIDDWEEDVFDAIESQPKRSKKKKRKDNVDKAKDDNGEGKFKPRYKGVINNSPRYCAWDGKDDDEHEFGSWQEAAQRADTLNSVIAASIK